MHFLRDDRSQAIQIGAVLIFGILVVFLALYQGFVVPNQNEKIEFDHNQQLQSEMTDMRSAVISMPGRTTTQSVSLTLGVRYPSRALFVNPGPASGSLRTVGTTNAAINLTIENATANGEVGDFWDGTARSYNTGGIEYRPNYNLFATAPRTIYEHSVLYNDFGDDTTIPITGQAMVNDDRITLVTLNGSISESRVGDAAIDFEPVSTNTRTVEIYNETHPITISVPTRMKESEWEDVFEEEVDNGNVTAVHTTALPSVNGLSMLEIDLEPGTYSLQLAKIGVGTDITQTREAYLTDTAGNGTTIQKGQTQMLELEVRDPYNNPVSGVKVNGSAEKGVFTSSDAKTVTTETDENGQLMLEYKGLNPDTNDINFTIQGGYDPVAGTPHTAEAIKNVTMTVTVNAPPSSDSGSGSAAFNVSWLDPSNEPGTKDCNDSSCVLNHTDAEQLTLTMDTDKTADNAAVEFAVNDTTVGNLNSSKEFTNADGEASVTLQPQANGTVNVYASSGGSGDTIEITVEDYNPAPFFDLTIDDIDDPVDQGDNVDVTVTVENTGGKSGTQVIALDAGGQGQVDTTSVTLSDGETTTTTLTWDTTGATPGEYDLTVSSDNTTVTRTTTVQGLNFTGVSETFGTDDDELAFNVSNDRSDTVTLTGVRVDSTSTSATQIDNDQAFPSGPEVLVDIDSDGSAEYIENQNPAYDVGNRIDLGDTASFGSGADSRWNIRGFEENNGTPVSLAGEEVTITIWYEDSSGVEHQVQFTINSV